VHLVIFALAAFLSLGTGAQLPWAHGASVTHSAPASGPTTGAPRTTAPPATSMDGGLGGQPSH
jgi:hypothetical protein